MLVTERKKVKGGRKKTNMLVPEKEKIKRTRKKKLKINK